MSSIHVGMALVNHKGSFSVHHINHFQGDWTNECENYFSVEHFRCCVCAVLLNWVRVCQIKKCLSLQLLPLSRAPCKNHPNSTQNPRTDIIQCERHTYKKRCSARYRMTECKLVSWCAHEQCENQWVFLLLDVSIRSNWLLFIYIRHYCPWGRGSSVKRTYKHRMATIHSSELSKACQCFDVIRDFTIPLVLHVSLSV